LAHGSVFLECGAGLAHFPGGQRGTQLAKALGPAHALSPSNLPFDALAHAAQMQALLRAASGTCVSTSALKCTRVHQHGPGAAAPAPTVVAGVAMAQALDCPHKGHRQGSTAGSEKFMGWGQHFGSNEG